MCGGLACAQTVANPPTAAAAVAAAAAAPAAPPSGGCDLNQLLAARPARMWPRVDLLCLALHDLHNDFGRKFGRIEKRSQAFEWIIETVPMEPFIPSTKPAMVDQGQCRRRPGSQKWALDLKASWTLEQLQRPGPLAGDMAGALPPSAVAIPAKAWSA